MDTLRSIFYWFSGGDVDHQYNTLWHCLNQDLLWIIISVTLDLAIATGYVVIAFHWKRNAKFLPDSPAKRALGDIRMIFIWCGICGYLFMPIKLFWPAWRLYDIFLLILVIYTWRYVVSAQNLRVVYNELGRTSKLVEDLKASQADVARRGAFLNAISHDLRTPLNGISLRTELAELQLQAGDHQTLQHTLADLRTSNQSLAALLDQLLDYARIDHAQGSLTVEPFLLDDVVHAIITDVQPVADQKGISLESVVPEGLTLHTDRSRVQRILSNFLSNAIKYTPAGTHAGDDRAAILVAAEASRNGVEIHVIDQGIGIAAEKQPRIFEEFFQLGNDARDSTQGFGLGLPIARTLALQLGGEIRVQSTPGSGSRFTLVLPHRRPQAPKPTDATGES